MRRIRHFFEQSWLLIVAAFFFGLLIAVTNAALSPRIELNKVSKLTTLAKGLLPQAEKFAPLKTEIEVKTLDGRKQKINVYRAITDGQTAGWVFKALGSGWGGTLELGVVVDGSFKTMAGLGILVSNETVGFGDQIKEDYFRRQFAGAPAERLSLVSTGSEEKIDSEIVAISGATVSSTAVVDAVNHYLPQVKEKLQQKGLIGDGS